jgi:crossover junction endodeoxyribonuclease RuvC
MATRILGVDPGLQTTGYAVVEKSTTKPVVIEAGVIRPAVDGATDLAQRIASLYDGIADVMTTLRPAAVAVEQLYAHYDHPRTAILMGHARGVLLLAAAKHNLEVTSYSATRVKKTITGHGRASKEQMQLAIQRELGLTSKPEPADVADALAVALCHCYAMSVVGGSLSIAKPQRAKAKANRFRAD